MAPHGARSAFNSFGHEINLTQPVAVKSLCDRLLKSWNWSAQPHAYTRTDTCKRVPNSIKRCIGILSKCVGINWSIGMSVLPFFSYRVVDIYVNLKTNYRIMVFLGASNSSFQTGLKKWVDGGIRFMNVTAIELLKHIVDGINHPMFFFNVWFGCGRYVTAQIHNQRRPEHAQAHHSHKLIRIHATACDRDFVIEWNFRVIGSLSMRNGVFC